MRNYVWIYISDDEYELPLHIADTANELGNILGVKGKSIVNIYNRYIKDGKNCRYRKVYIGDV